MTISTESAPTIDPRTFRDVMGHYPTGVVLVTAMLEGQPVGMVVGTFSSVSLEPPLVSFMPMTTSGTYAKLRQADSLCINVLAHDQSGACRTLASKDPEKFSKVDWELSEHGAPQLAGAVAYIHCRLEQEVEAGDHYISLCAVDDLQVARPVTPLLFFQGGYGGFSTTGMAAYLDEELISAVRVAESARPQLNRLAEKHRCSAAALIQIEETAQTIGASSYGGSTEMDERIGVRIPLIPPLGEAAVAWSPDQSQRWLDQIFPRDEDVIAGYRETLEKVRSQGYAVARIEAGDEEGYSRLSEALREYGLGELTPVREREVRKVFAESYRYFGGSIGADETELNLASVVVPVFDPAEGPPCNSGLVLRLGHLPQGVDAAVAETWVEDLQQAADEVRATLASAAQRDYSRYQATGLRGQS